MFPWELCEDILPTLQKCHTSTLAVSSVFSSNYQQKREGVTLRKEETLFSSGELMLSFQRYAFSSGRFDHWKRKAVGFVMYGMTTW